MRDVDERGAEVVGVGEVVVERRGPAPVSGGTPSTPIRAPSPPASARSWSQPDVPVRGERRRGGQQVADLDEEPGERRPLAPSCPSPSGVPSSRRPCTAPRAPRRPRASSPGSRRASPARRPTARCGWRSAAPVGVVRRAERVGQRHGVEERRVEGLGGEQLRVRGRAVLQVAGAVRGQGADPALLRDDPSRDPSAPRRGPPSLPALRRAPGGSPARVRAAASRPMPGRDGTGPTGSGRYRLSTLGRRSAAPRC